MNTLRQAVRDYLAMRRGLGFKLRDAGRELLNFATFMERHRTSYITQALALAWAQQPGTAQPVWWAQRLSFVRGFARYRSDRKRRFRRRICYPSDRSGRARICIRMKRLRAYCAQLSRCHTAMNVRHCDLGSSIVYSDCCTSRDCASEKHATSSLRMSI